MKSIRIDAEVMAWLKAERKRTGKKWSQIVRELLAKTKIKASPYD